MANTHCADLDQIAPFTFLGHNPNLCILYLSFRILTAFFRGEG